MNYKLNSIFGAMLLAGSSVANSVEIPNQFTSGGTASAAEVNQNFDTLAAAINSQAAEANQNFNTLTAAIDSNSADVDALNSVVNNMALFTQTHFSTSDFNPEVTNISAIVIATCPAETLLVGGSVSCHSENFDPDTTNFGVVSFAEMAENSMIGGCSADALLFRDGLYGPPVTANAVCLSYGPNVLTRSMPRRTELQGQPSLKALEKLEQAKNRMAIMEQIAKDRAALQAQ